MVLGEGIIVGVQGMERAREVDTILLNEMWHSVVINFGYVSSRMIWIKFRFVWW